MFITNLFENYVKEDNGPEVVVVYPGRFQPFHLGHKEVFNSLQNKFGRDNVYIATSNKTDGAKSPFNFSDKTIFMNAAGIPSDRIIEISNPYALPQQFNPENTIFVAVVGSPDKNRLNPDSTKKDGSASYFKMFDSFEKAVTADQHGYVIIADERNKQITLGDKTVDVSHGTQTRAAWNAVRKDPKLRSQFLKQMYGRDDPEVGRVLDKIAETVNENGGYVPMNKKEANDDRFRMALSVDVGIGEPWKQAKKMGLLKDKIQILGEEIEALKEKLVAEAPPKPVIKAVAPPKQATSYSAEQKLREFENWVNEAEMKNDPCWDGYEMIGHKEKGGKKVPNCVPKKSVKEQAPMEYEGEPPQQKTNPIGVIRQGKKVYDMVKGGKVKDTATQTVIDIIKNATRDDASSRNRLPKFLQRNK